MRATRDSRFTALTRPFSVYHASRLSGENWTLPLKPRVVVIWRSTGAAGAFSSSDQVHRFCWPAAPAAIKQRLAVGADCCGADVDIERDRRRALANSVEDDFGRRAPRRGAVPAAVRGSVASAGAAVARESVRAGRRVAGKQIAELVFAKHRRVRHEIDANDLSASPCAATIPAANIFASGLQRSSRRCVFEVKLTWWLSPPASGTTHALTKPRTPPER